MSESFCTLKVRLSRPTRRKQQLLDACFEAYAASFQALLERKKDQFERLAADALTQDGRCPSLASLLRLFTPADRACLKAFGLEPFADSLVQDLAMMLRSHLALRLNQQRTRYPLLRTPVDLWPDLVRAQIDAWTLEHSHSARQLGKALTRSHETVGRIKSIYLGRHAENRDFCMLYQPATGRFFAKIFLMNRSRAKTWHLDASANPQHASADPLYHLTSDHTLLPLPTKQDRFVIFPLDMGQEQKDRLLAAWGNPGLLRSARLCQTEKGVDLHIHMRRLISADDFGTPLHWIGLVRSSQAACALSICRKDGSLIRQEQIDLDPNSISLEPVVATVRKLVRQTHAQLILPDLARYTDGLYRDGLDGLPVVARLAKKEWLKLVEKIQIGLSRSGLPLPIQISPHHIYQTCPRCKSNRKSNRSLPTLLVCITCGFSQDVSLAASHNLVVKYFRYHKDKQARPVVSDPPGLTDPVA